MTFVDNLEALEAKVAELQREVAALDRDKQELSGETRLANHRAAQAEHKAEQLEVEVQSATRRANEAGDRAAFTAKLQEEVYTERDRANEALASEAVLSSRLAISEKARKKSEGELKNAREILRAREDGFLKAEKLLAAFEARQEADKVILGA